MGLAIDPKKNLILSVAEDKKFKITDLSYQEAQTGTSLFNTSSTRYSGRNWAAENDRIRP